MEDEARGFRCHTPIHLPRISIRYFNVLWRATLETLPVTEEHNFARYRKRELRLWTFYPIGRKEEHRIIAR